MREEEEEESDGGRRESSEGVEDVESDKAEKWVEKKASKER